MAWPLERSRRWECHSRTRVLAYLNLRHRIPAAIRRPVWVLVTAQAVAGILLPAVYIGIGIAVVVGGILLLILLLVMLGDLRRS